MENTIGKKIAYYRKTKNLTQDDLAERLNVSPQAVSKWENDQSCPDILLLKPLSQILEVSIDELLSEEEKRETVYLPKSERCNFDDMLMRVIVLSAAGDKVRANLPLPIVKLGMEFGTQMLHIVGNNDVDVLQNIDLAKVLQLAEQGVIGKLFEIESVAGDIVEVWVE